jgi:hypothetical protein
MPTILVIQVEGQDMKNRSLNLDSYAISQRYNERFREFGEILAIDLCKEERGCGQYSGFLLGKRFVYFLNGQLTPFNPSQAEKFKDQGIEYGSFTEQETVRLYKVIKEYYAFSESVKLAIYTFGPEATVKKLDTKVEQELDILSKEERAIAVIRNALGPDGHNSEGCKICKKTLDRLRGITGHCTFPIVSRELQCLVAHAHCMSRHPIEDFCEYDLMMYIDCQKRFFKQNFFEEDKKHHRHPNGYLDDLSQEVIAISIEFFETLTPNLEDCY